VERELLAIVKYGDEILKRRAEPVRAIDDQLRALVEHMVFTMYQAPGVGLAAPQVGQSIQLCTVDPSQGETPGELITLINPEIIARDGEELSDEGCLSLPGFVFPVKRFTRILLKALTLDGKEVQFECAGFKARVIQHELDHLNGTLIIDHISPLKRSLAKKEIKRLKQSEQW
jgi:peptide deformylase